MEQTNEYLNQVVADQAKVDQELRHRQPLAPAGKAKGRGRAVVEFRKGIKGEEGQDCDEDLGGSSAAPGQPVDYHVTGFWLWQTVVVQPNVYVVHTRRGRPEPLHIGLGLSFRYNPSTDAFLVIPATVQTLIINAKCICAERQGILVQAYVQWIVEDVRTAYRKLDFSDPQDPMRIVNVQLREQAEAAIKDKVATMSIDAVLSDKQPIIEELTHRLRLVAEGNREGTEYTGLGLKIVTVQIKEAVVSSTRLWENLQRPFRAEREKLARMAQLQAEQEIARKELANRQAAETAELEHARRMAQLRAEQEQQAVAERTATEKVRMEAELEVALRQFEAEGRRRSQELAAVQGQAELERARAEQEKARAAAAAEVENLVHQAQSARAERDLALFKARRAAENDLSEQHVRAQLIARLPEVAASMPRPNELRAVSIHSDNGGATAPLVGFLASLLQLADGAGKGRESSGSAPG